MHQDIPKQFINVYDKPVIIYTLEGFQREIDAIEVVCLDGWHDILKAYAKQFNIDKLKMGGIRRKYRPIHPKRRVSSGRNLQQGVIL